MATQNRTVVAALSVLLAVSRVASGQASDSTSSPTEFESFVSDANATVIDRENLGQLASPDSIVVLSAVTARGGDDAGTMRGVRVEMRTAAWSDTVYLDEHQVADLSLQLSMMSRMIEAMRDPTHPRSTELLYGNRSFGAEQCWPAANPQSLRLLCPTYQIVEGFERFYLEVFGSTEEYPLSPDSFGEFGRLVFAASTHWESREDDLAEAPPDESDESDELTPLEQPDVVTRDNDARVIVPAVDRGPDDGDAQGRSGIWSSAILLGALAIAASALLIILRVRRVA